MSWCRLERAPFARMIICYLLINALIPFEQHPKRGFDVIHGDSWRLRNDSWLIHGDSWRFMEIHDDSWRFMAIHGDYEMIHG
jgi:hypothetical protein